MSPIYQACDSRPPNTHGASRSRNRPPCLKLVVHLFRVAVLGQRKDKSRNDHGHEHQRERAAIGGGVIDTHAIGQRAVPALVEDPADRLHAISESTEGAKEDHNAIGARTLTDWAEWAAPRTFGLASRLYSSMNLANSHRPIHNLVISNVPGPPFPLYLAGAEPAEVWATGGMYHHQKPEPFDTINAAIRFANGATGCFMGGDGGTGGILQGHPLPCGCPFWVTVVSKGRSATAIDHGHDARFESTDPSWTPPYTSREYGKELGERPAGGVPDILPAFAMSILKAEKPIATAHDGARTTRFILRCFESARTGKVMTF